MTSSNPTKDQHFVPRFYLKNFASDDGNLEVLNVKEKRMEKRKPYQGLGYAHYFYAAKTGVQDNISQEIEEWFRPMENIIARKLPKIIKTILGNQHIENNDRYILSVLMSMLWLRTPGMRNQLKQMRNNLAEEIENDYGSKNANKFKSKDNISHLKFMVNSIGFGDSGFANMFFGMKWKAYISRGNEVFITSDSPIVEKWLPPEGFYGASFLERNKYFALTPQILFELTYPKGATKIKRKTLYKDQDDKVKTLNIILASGAHKFAYSGNRSCLEQLLAGRENPGRLGKEYIKKYVLPWAKYHMKMKKQGAE